tara:strand:+ start:17119 stop:17502 length:384 start_codon:yes stop_codon:yes gene_type:complete
MTKLSIIYIILFIAQGIFWTAYAKMTNLKQYNNNAPRDFLNSLTGSAKRSYWAHLNSNEALPIFMTVIICANISGVSPNTIHLLGAGALITRIIYGVLYIKDLASPRSIVWALSYLCKALLLIACIF